MTESADNGTQNASLARSTAGMAAGTIASRVLGVVRAGMQAAVVGLALTGDAWDVANTLPNIVYLLLAGGVLNAVLVPQITRAASHADGGREYVDRLLTIAIIGLAVVAVVFTLAAGLLVRLYSSPRWDPDVRSLSISFALICMPQIFFYGLYTLLGQVLNARNHFAAYMWAPVVANLVAIGGMAYFLLSYPHEAGAAHWTSSMIWVLAGSATAGVAAVGVAAAIAVDGQRFDVRPNVVLERPRRLIEPPDDWLRRGKPPPRDEEHRSGGRGPRDAGSGRHDVDRHDVLLDLDRGRGDALPVRQHDGEAIARGRIKKPRSPLVSAALEPPRPEAPVGDRSRAVRAPGPVPPGRAARASSSCRWRRRGGSQRNYCA